MLDYIKQRIQAMQPEPSNLDEELENDAIMECAHLIQELDDLSIEGSPLNAARDIDALSISLDDDVELSAVEFSIADGRLLDTPADILVHSEHYEYMKSIDDFVEEAANQMPRQYMEDDNDYNNRIMEAANAKYDAYKQYIIQEGLFSSNKVNLSDPAVQWYRNIDFGPDPITKTGAPCVLRLPVGYIPADRAGTKILVKQRDSIAVIIDNHPEFGEAVAKGLADAMQKKGYEIPKGRSFWEICVPKMILIPMEPVDKFCVFIEAENVLAKTKEDDYIYVGFAIPIKASRGIKTISDVKADVADMPKVGLSNISLPSIKHGMSFIDKSAMIKESYREKTPIGRFVQEEISFGEDTPPGGEEKAATDVPAAEDDTPPADDATAEVPKEEVKSNDIAPQIADEVKKQEDENTANAAANGDAGDAVEGNADATGEGLDTPATDIEPNEGESLDDNPDVQLPEDGDVDAALNDLNNTGNDAALDDTTTALGGADLDNMSPEQIKAAVADKVDKMPMSAIKAFLSDDTDTNDDIGGDVGEVPADGAVTEAFVLTKKNINGELDVCLRKCLGDLNDTSKDLNDILNAFKKDGKKLNRALSKASKMAEVYGDEERNKFIKLNKCTADLIVSFSAAKMDVKVTKRLIKAFTSSSVIVGKIIEKHKNSNGDDAKPSRVVD